MSHAAEIYFGKHKTTGRAHLFPSDTEGELMHISDPLLGNRMPVAFHQASAA